MRARELIHVELELMVLTKDCTVLAAVRHSAQRRNFRCAGRWLPV